jgi:hypothetical protein
MAIGTGYHNYISPMGGESAIVVERRKELTYLLCQAAELEHALMCQYLYAAFSLKSTAGPGLRAGQLEAVEHWRLTILAIAGRRCCIGPWSRTCSRPSGLPLT